ncbi:hypothetical protein FQZ97_1091730 [compost metagenome]
MQHQDRIAAVLLDAFDYGIAHGQPVGLGHVGAVQRRRNLAEDPIWCWVIRVSSLLGSQPGFEAGSRCKAGIGHLHSDGAAGVEHQELAGGGHDFSVIVVLQSQPS